MKQLTNKLLAVAMLVCLGVGLQAQTTDVILTVTPLSFPGEIHWDLLDGSSAVVATRACGSYGVTSVDTLTLNDGETYTFNAFDDWGDSWNGGTWSIARVSDGCVLAGGIGDNGAPGDAAAGCLGSDLEESVSFDPAGAISGCTNPAATNYNPCATIDDGSCVFPAVNDECVDAIAIAPGTCYTGTNVGATFSTDTLSPTCVDGSSTPADIWFTSTVGADSTLIFEFPVVPGISSIIELYQSGNCGSLGAGILGTAGSCFNYGPGGSVTVGGLTPGPITIRYWDFGSDDFGTLEFCVSVPVFGCTDPCATNYNPAANTDDGSCVLPPVSPGTGAEECASAITLPGDGTYNISNIGAGGTDISSCTFGDSLDVWVCYNVPTGLDSLWISTCGSTYDTGLSLWSACPDSTEGEIACNDDGVVGGLGSECDGSIFQSAICLVDSALDAIEGTTIYIRVAGFGGQSGCGDLIIESIAPECSSATPPQNPSHTNGVSAVTLTWDALPLSVACNVQGTRLSPLPSVSGQVFIFGSEPTSTNVPYGAAGAGSTWEWKVRCACSISPVDASGFSVTDTFSVPTLREGQIEANSMVYPSPADQEVYFTYSTEQASAGVEFQVVDMLGRVVDTRSIDVEAGITTVRFDVADLETGAYFVQIIDGDYKATENFTIAR